MAKRFTDTNKYKKPFIRGLQGAYKLLWDFIYHDCDHAGIWIVDFDIAQIYVGSDMAINKKDALIYFNKNKKRIIEVDNGERWFIPSFIDIQYGKLNPENRAHLSVIKILDKYKGFKSPLEGAKDKDKDKDNLITHKEFYDTEKWGVGGKYRDKYSQFVDFLYGKNDMNQPLTKALNLKEQVSFENFGKLMDKISVINNKKGEVKVLLTEMLMNMYNDPKYLNGKASLYLTLNNWINRER